MTKNEEQIIMQIYENLSNEIKELKQSTDTTASSSDPQNWSPAAKKMFNTIIEGMKIFDNKLNNMQSLMIEITKVMLSDKIPEWLKELSEKNQNLHDYAVKLDNMLVELQSIKSPSDPPPTPNTFRIEVKNRNLLYIFILTLLLLIASVAVNCHQLLLSIVQ